MNLINAQKVFLERIIIEIKKYYSGGYLWIPMQDYKERNEKICILYEKEESVRNIAKKMNFTERRILYWVWKLGTGGGEKSEEIKNGRFRG